jgi:hypothetical protein
MIFRMQAKTGRLKQSNNEVNRLIMNTIKASLGEGLLQLRPLLAGLVADGRLSAGEAKKYCCAN